jgi:glycosyltransferase involved in cell wall biosynthesis
VTTPPATVGRPTPRLRPRVPRSASVVVAHPGGQHELQAVLAAQEHGLLEAFATGFYLEADSQWSRAVRRIRSVPIGRRMLISATNRAHPRVATDRVVSFPIHHVIAKAARRTWASERASEWASARWDAAVASWLMRLSDPPALIHVFEGGALSILAGARRRGIAGVLDVPIAHEYARLELEREGVPVRGTAVTARIQAERARADHILAPSEFVVRCLVEHGVEPEKIVRLPFGADVQHQVGNGERRDGVFRALFVGQVAPRKGVRYLLDAWRRLALPNSELVLVGGGGRAASRLLRTDGGQCRWIGQVPRAEVRRWFECSDVFVFPSLAEGSALVTYEAMAAGLPVITTANSGAVVREGIDGFIVPPRDIDALAERILLLSRSPYARQEMGAQARVLIEEHYTWSHYNERLSVVYEAILDGRDPRRALDAVFDRGAATEGANADRV